MNAWRRWRRLGKSVGAEGDPGAFFFDLKGRYEEPGRAYHTLRHVQSCLEELDRVRALCGRPVAVELALWFHDAVYDPQASDNEAKSAALLREAAASMRIDSEIAGEAEQLVHCTAHVAEAQAAAGDAAVMCDIDLSILGAPRRRFDAYESAVRREYAFLSSDAWRAGRRKVLESFLQRPFIYSTADFRERLEDQARRNLRRSLARLTPPDGVLPASPPPR